MLLSRPDIRNIPEASDPTARLEQEIAVEPTNGFGSECIRIEHECRRHACKRHMKTGAEVSRAQSCRHMHAEAMTYASHFHVINSMQRAVTLEGRSSTAYAHCMEVM